MSDITWLEEDLTRELPWSIKLKVPDMDNVETLREHMEKLYNTKPLEGVIIAIIEEI